MEELFNKLFESDLLNEETKTEMKTLIESAIEVAIAAKEIEIKTQLAEDFVKEKDALVEALDTKVQEALTTEFTELREDLQRFRDLEVESAQKLVEAREEMAAVVQSDMKELIEALDAFVETRMDAEIAELKEELDDARKMAFGKKLFETFAKEFKTNFYDEKSAEVSLATAKKTLSVTSGKLEEAQKEVKAMKREKEMGRVLESLTDKPREVMLAILGNVPTEKLEDTYKTYIGRVLHKSVETNVGEVSEKENVEVSSTPVLAEGDTSTGVELKVVTGNETLKEDAIDESSKPRMDESSKDKLRKWAGIV